MQLYSVFIVPNTHVASFMQGLFSKQTWSGTQEQFADSSCHDLYGCTCSSAPAQIHIKLETRQSLSHSLIHYTLNARPRKFCTQKRSVRLQAHLALASANYLRGCDPRGCTQDRARDPRLRARDPDSRISVLPLWWCWCWFCWFC